MEEEKFSLSGTFQKTKEYIDSQFKLVKLKTIERSSRLIASLVVDATKLIFTLFVLFFLCLALGFWLGELLGVIPWVFGYSGYFLSDYCRNTGF
jgi:hypothetical protein